MTYRITLFAACACAGLLTALATQAMPLAAQNDAASQSWIQQVEFRLFGGDEHREAGGDDDSYRWKVRNGHHYEDDDADEDGWGSSRGMVPQQSSTPPSNGLFAPGGKPQVQVN